ncbi:hypothetical protein GIB67_009003 [Kingdonia uniflora]|uniref:DUF6857 domain-containing protein n=1 Tax=Kingdonia uniflora TaxID=39325 RepID=A0A7J7LVV2_9MAGN|nr:hypothetical protein GIB67_009003 [Kingdonia uniflora]
MQQGIPVTSSLTKRTTSDSLLSGNTTINVLDKKITPVKTKIIKICPFRQKPDVVVHNVKGTSVPVKGSSPSEITTKVKNLHLFPNTKDKNRAQETISWDSLPVNLVKPGKVMLRRINLAFMVAIEAHKEASAAATLTRCLSLFSDLCASASTEEPNVSLTRFFTLYRLIDQPNTTSNLENVPADISINSAPSKKKCNKNTLLAHNRNISKAPKASLDLTTIGRLEWAKGDGAKEIQELRDSLLKETQAWFLKFLETSLNNGFQKDTRGKNKKDGDHRRLKKKTDDQIGVTLSQLKHASDWLDHLRSKLVVGNDGAVENVVDGLKQKIYACLLGHVDSTALALKSLSDRD